MSSEYSINRVKQARAHAYRQWKQRGSRRAVGLYIKCQQWLGVW
jgi:hypothetical protein